MDTSSAKRSVVFGGILFLVGLALVVAAHSAAAEGGGTQRTVVAWAAMIFGAIRIIYGVVKLSSSKKPS